MSSVVKLFSCNTCGRDDIPFEDMCKDKSKPDGIKMPLCLACRKNKNKVSRGERLRREAEEHSRLLEVARKERRAARQRAGRVKDECDKCEKTVSTERLFQPPVSVLPGLGSNARWCSECIAAGPDDDDLLRAARVEAGLKADATCSALESRARVLALQKLVENHPSEFRNLLARQRSVLGADVERKWVSL